MKFLGCPSCGSQNYDIYTLDLGERHFYCNSCGYDGDASEIERDENEEQADDARD